MTTTMLRLVVYDGKERVSQHLVASPDLDATTLAQLVRDALRGRDRTVKHPETLTVFVQRGGEGNSRGGAGGDGDSDSDDDGDDGTHPRWRCLDRAAVHQSLREALPSSSRGSSSGRLVRIRVQLDPHDGDAARAKHELARQARQQARRQAREQLKLAERRALEEEQKAWERERRPGPSPHELARRQRRDRRRAQREERQRLLELARQSAAAGGEATPPLIATTTDEEEDDSESSGDVDDDDGPSTVAADAAAPVDAPDPSPPRLSGPQPRLLTAAKWALRALVAAEALALARYVLWPGGGGQKRSGSSYFEAWRKQGWLEDERGGKRRGKGRGRGGQRGRHERPSVWDSYVGLSTESGGEAWESYSSSSSPSSSSAPPDNDARGPAAPDDEEKRRRAAARDARRRLLGYLSGREPVGTLHGVGSEALEQAAEEVRTEELEAAIGGGGGRQRVGGRNTASPGLRARFREQVADVVAAMRRSRQAQTAFERAAAARSAERAAAIAAAAAGAGAGTARRVPRVRAGGASGSGGSE
jgi:hypothetical protein